MRELINVINDVYDFEAEDASEKNRYRMHSYTGEHVAILDAYSSFLNSTRVLDDINFWNFEKLMPVPDGKETQNLRKPRIILNLHVTSRGNLVLEWEPMLNSDGSNDFLYNNMWLNLTPPFEEPRNRLFRIDNFSLFSENYGAPNQLTPLEGKQLSAVVELVKSVISSLGGRFEVSESNGILRESSRQDSFREANYYLLPTTRIDEIVSAHNVEVFKEEGDYWIQKELVEKLGLEADDLVSAYISCGRHYHRTAIKLAPTLKPGAKITASKVENRLSKLLYFKPNKFDIS